MGTDSGTRLLKKVAVASKGYPTVGVLRFLCQFAFLLGSFLLVRLKPWSPYRLAALVAVVAAGILWQKWSRSPSGGRFLEKAAAVLSDGRLGDTALKLLGQFAFLLGSFLLTYPKTWPIGHLTALVVLVAAAVLWPEWIRTQSGLRLLRPVVFQNLTIGAVSILFTFVVIGLPLKRCCVLTIPKDTCWAATVPGPRTWFSTATLGVTEMSSIVWRSRRGSSGS